VGASIPGQAAGAQVASGDTPGDTFSCCCSSVSFSPSTFLCIAASWAVVDKNIHTIGAKQVYSNECGVEKCVAAVACECLCTVV
jgi:hypothetical protein